MSLCCDKVSIFLSTSYDLSYEYRQYLQAQEIVYPATIINISSVIICIGANYILIYGFFLIPGLGFVGSPLAMFIASAFQPIALVLYACVLKKYHQRTSWLTS